MKSVSAAFPVYNERATVEQAIRSFYQVCVDNNIEHEILICDDASNDGTAQILERLALEIPSLKIYTNDINRGVIYSVKKLYALATREFVFTNSADLQWDNRILLELLNKAVDYDIIIAARISKKYNFFRSTASAIFNLIPRLIFCVDTKDAGAAKMYRKEVLEKIPVISASPFSEAERLIRAAKRGYRIGAVPVDISVRAHGKAKGISFKLLTHSIADVVRVFIDLMILRRR